MNTTLDWDLWKPIFLSLAGGTTLVFFLAFVMQRRMGSMSWRRTIWQIAFLSLGLLMLAETTGAQRWARSWLRQTTTDAEGTLLVESKILDEPNLQLLSTPRAQDSVAAFSSARRSSIAPTVTAWPAVLWLAGTAAAASWIVAIRMAFLVRMRRRTVRDESLLARANAIARRLGVTGRLHLSEARELAGPIAFGVFRPGITLPERFCRRFTAPQQDVMLAHELAHLSARDPFWHLLADLVTALLWWHPMVWFAKRELRAASEAAADEASLVVENGPATLAECLVELGGRLTRTRSLGWLGVEGDSFRSGLGKRVRRLVTLDNPSWNRPSRPRLWLARGLTSAPLVVLVLLGTAWARPESPAAETLRQAFQRSVIGIALTAAMPAPQEAIAPPTNVVEEVLAPPAPPKAKASTVPAPSAPAADEPRRRLNQKLDSIVLKEISFDDEPLRAAVEKLSRLVKSRDPEGKGINFIVSNEDASPGIDPVTGLPVAAGIDFQQAFIRRIPPMKGVTVREALNELIRSASVPLIYQVEANVVMFSPKDAERLALHTRFFRIYPETFGRALATIRSLPFGHTNSVGEIVRKVARTNSPAAATNSGPEQLLTKAKEFFTEAGVDFSMPGKQIAYGDGQEKFLMIRATLQDLGLVEQVLQVLNTPPPQIVLEVKFFEVTAEDARVMGFDWFLGGVFTQMSNNSVSQKTNFQGTGVLTEAQSRVVLQAMEQRGLTNLLGASKMITLSGRQGQFKNVRVRYIVTDLDWSHQATNSVGGTNDRLHPQPIAEPFELGPMLDVVPFALTDGQTIQMTLIPTLTEFLGYDPQKQNRQETVTMPDGRKEIVTVPDQPFPIFRKLQMTSSAMVRDGQTVVLAGGSEQFLANPKRSTPLPKGTKMPGEIKTTSLLIFVTPTLVDAAGNRINPPE